MNDTLTTRLRSDLAALREQGLYKGERVLEGPQGGLVRAGGREVINLCANNYLGSPTTRPCAPPPRRPLDRYGYGMASVRFICGTDELHKKLEQRLARFLGTEDTILYSSCFDANGGLFETLLDEQDAVISDALNHASIIDGIRLCKAQRLRYANNDMAELEQCLKDSKGARTRLIATDGVFSMDGFIAKLREICDLAERYDALVMVDDSHAVGFMGATGRGTPGALRCRRAHRHPHRHARQGPGRRQRRLHRRPAQRSWSGCGSARGRTCSPTASPRWSRPPASRCWTCWRPPRRCARSCSRTRASSATASASAGFELKPGEHPIIPVMLGDAALAARMAEELLDEGVYVIGFSFPVVPKGQARIRTQMSAALTRAELTQRPGRLHPGRPRAGRHRLKRAPRKKQASHESTGQRQAGPGIWLKDIEEPRVGPNDVLIKIAKTAICGTDMHIYNWDAWAQKTIPVPMAVGHEYYGRIVEIGTEVKGLKRRRPRLRRGPHHLRPLPQLPRRPAPPVPQHHRRRREPPRLLRRVPRHPGDNAFKLPDAIADDIACDPGPLRQRHPHRALLQPGRRGRADHRRRPHRHHGRGHRPPRRARATW